MKEVRSYYLLPCKGERGIKNGRARQYLFEVLVGAATIVITLTQNVNFWSVYE